MTSREDGGSPFAAAGARLVVPLHGHVLAILSDIHANLPALEAVVADIRRRGGQQILAAGDLVGYGPWPATCIDYIRGAGITSVAGNYDVGVGADLPSCGCAYRSPEQERSGAVSLAWTQGAVSQAQKRWLAGLPRVLEVHGEDGTPIAVIFHGSTRRVNEYLYANRPEESLLRLLTPERAPVAVCGHTHIPYTRKLPGNRLLVNCGSAGRPKSGRPLGSYVFLSWAHGTSVLPEVTIVEVPYQHERASGAVLASGLPTEFARLLLTGREQ